VGLTLAAQLSDVSVLDPLGGLLLDEVSIPVLPGEALAICGPTGGGKTTVLRLLSGLIRPTGGQVRVQGVDLATLGYEARRRMHLRVALVFEDGGFWSTRTVFENVALPLLYHRPAEAEAKVREVAAELELEGHLDQPGAALTATARRRAMLARALVLEPELLLFDDPQQGLLPREARVLSSAIERRRKERGMTVVYADHDGKLGPFACDHRVFLEGGRLVDRLSRLLSRHDREDFERGLPRDSLLGDTPESAS
jgi:ABC-type transporter Mla maintaining outer membrane lipid asymmetry ATPase subunit MlaF